MATREYPTRCGTTVPCALHPLSEGEQREVHQASLEVLSNPGMRIHAPTLRRALAAAGARVDEAREEARFPPELVEETLAAMREAIAHGRRQNVLNGVVSSRYAGRVGAKFGGACIRYFDWQRRCARDTEASDLVQLLCLGEALDDVALVGNPVTYLIDESGEPVPPHLQRVKTAAMVARYTTKCGPTEVWNRGELDFLMALGELVRGGRDAYLANPCFVTAKETISPLILDHHSGEVLAELARRGLPCTLIVMPLAGASSPVSWKANIIIANAEILGAFAALHALVPGILPAGGVITGILDMAKATTSFSAPEAVTQDLAIAQLHNELYGLDFGIGTGYTDAVSPGAQGCAEKMLKFTASALIGCHNYPVGLLDGGRTFSPEQALVDLDIARWAYHSACPSPTSPVAESVALIRQAGIGGSFLQMDDTLDHYREAFWMPAFIRRAGDDTEALYGAAARRVEELVTAQMAKPVDEKKWGAIDEIVREAERTLRPEQR